MSIPTYIINLKSSTDRKAYMENELAPFPYLEKIFVEGVDGRLMTCAEQEASFDQNAAFRRYGRLMGCGEVGCTLSHLECCRRFFESGNQSAIIVEDDLVMRQGDRLETVLQSMEKVIRRPKPTIILLTGDYWFLNKVFLCEEFELAKVFDAVCAGAYMLNVEAAKVLLNMGRSHIADDWMTIKNQGISLYALHPHVADQNRLDFQTTIANSLTGRTYRSNLSFGRRLVSYYNSFVKRLLKAINHFESKDFVW